MLAEGLACVAVDIKGEFLDIVYGIICFECIVYSCRQCV